MGAYSPTMLIINLITILFQSYVIFDFMSKFGRKVYRKKIFYIVGYVVLVLVSFVASSISDFGNEHLVVILITTVILGNLLFNNSKIYILYYSMFIIIIKAFEMLGAYFIMFYDKNVYLQIIVPTIMIQLIVLGASKLFIKWYKNKNIKSLTKVQYLNFLVLPVFSIFYIITLTNYSDFYITPEDSLLFLINIISIIILNIFITNIFQSIWRNNEMESSLKLYKQQSNMQYEYYSSLEVKYNNSRKLIHDMKNHLYSIERLYASNEREKVESYREDLENIFRELEHNYYTDNKVLNIILNDKIEKAQSYDIKVRCAIGSSEINFIKDIDLTTIFANLFDNAIEELRSIDEEKIIHLKMDKFNEFIVINMKNPLKSKPIERHGVFKSTKKNHSGLGLKNVRLTIEKYDGDLRVDFKDEYFKINIAIPIS